MSNFPYQVYCDMDGVLVDFMTGAVQRINEALTSPPLDLSDLAASVVSELGRNYILPPDIYKKSDGASKAARDFMYRLLEREEDFWEQLPWTQEGRRLWAYLEPYNPILLTSPMDQGGYTQSTKGKKKWAKSNLAILDTNKRMIFAHKKYEYAIKNGKACVLIDDFKHKIEPFREHGGIGIHHTSVDETIQALKELKNGSNAD
jgi:hypothetical protein